MYSPARKKKRKNKTTTNIIPEPLDTNHIRYAFHNDDADCSPVRRRLRLAPMPTARPCDDDCDSLRCRLLARAMYRLLYNINS
ncbi:MAG: hypothetical protein ACPLX7_10260 [Candidatus Kapaibacteriota bacterium]